MIEYTESRRRAGAELGAAGRRHPDDAVERRHREQVGRRPAVGEGDGRRRGRDLQEVVQPLVVGRRVRRHHVERPGEQHRDEDERDACDAHEPPRDMTRRTARSDDGNAAAIAQTQLGPCSPGAVGSRSARRRRGRPGARARERTISTCLRLTGFRAGFGRGGAALAAGLRRHPRRRGRARAGCRLRPRGAAGRPWWGRGGRPRRTSRGCGRGTRARSSRRCRAARRRA